MRAEDPERPIRTATRWGVSVGALVFFAVLLDPTSPALDRTAVPQRYASNFFELQADALMHGRLAVPNGSLGIEGFVRHGHTYMYFPPFPAVIRIPVMLVTREFDGRMSLVSMGVAWVVFAIMATKLFWLVRSCVRGTQPVARAEAVLSAIALAAITGGTVLVFDAALPWVYHEVYLWATALAIGSLYWLLRVGLEPAARSVWWLGAFNLCLIMTRTTGGFALCAATTLMACRLLIGRTRSDRRRLGWAVLATGILPVAAAVALNLIKFDHPYLFPLQDQVWTQFSARRREALARNGGTITGPQFLATGVVNYLQPFGIRFTSYFPWITLPARPASAYGGAFLDQSYRTGSVPAFMPFLTLMTLWAMVRVYVRRHAPTGIRELRLPLLAALVIPVGVLSYGYVAHRYLSEFVPLVVLGTMIGCADLAAHLPKLGRLATGSVLTVLSALVLFGILANGLTGYTLEQQTWGGSKLEGYVAAQRALGGNLPVVHTTQLPSSAPTDELAIVGRCDGLYLATGDQYEPWLPVERRTLRIRIVLGGVTRAGLLPLLTVHGLHVGSVDAQLDSHGHLRFVMSDGGNIRYSPWQLAVAGSEIDLIVTTHTDLKLIELEALPGGFVGWLPLTQIATSGDTLLVSITPSFATRAAQQDAGVRIVAGASPAPTQCAQFAHDGTSVPGG